MNKRMKRNLALSLMVGASLTGAVTASALTKDDSATEVNKQVEANAENKDMEVKEGLTDIGITSLYAKEMGKHNGVSVVFDTGYGDGIELGEGMGVGESWAGIQEEVSKLTNTLVYDRAGIGKSGDVPNRPNLSDEDREAFMNYENIGIDRELYKDGMGKTATDRAIQLHKLLKERNVPGPYVLVVHSISSLEAIEFARMFGDELAGIVMVDGSSQNVIQSSVNYFTEHLPEMIDPFLGQFTEADGTLDEVLQSELQAWNAGDVLRDIPLKFLQPSDTGQGEIFNQIRNEEVDYWLSLSDKSERVSIDNVGHYIHLDDPQAVIDAVNDTVKELTNK